MQKASTPQQSDHGHATDTGPARVLVVEDQRAVAGALRMRLRGLGYEVVDIAQTGDEAVTKARQLAPDLILMDIRLGDGIDGIEAARQIQIFDDIPIVYVTAYADHELLGRARQTSPAGFINKPFTTKDLLTTLELAMHRRDDRGEDGSERGVVRDAVMTTDQQGMVSFITSSAESFIGLSRHEVIGQPLAGILPHLYPMTESHAGETIEGVLAGGETALLERSDNDSNTADALVALSDNRGNLYGLALHFGGSETDNSIAVVQRLANAYQFVLDRVPIGVVVIDAERNISHLNEHARQIFANCEILFEQDGKLCCEDVAHQTALYQLIARTSAQDRENETESEIITFGDEGEKARIVAIASPVPEIDQAGHAPLLALLVFDMTHRRELSASALRQTYGLTRSEVRLVQNLVGGCSLEDGARELGITVNTARTHLKHIFTKTGARRQSELIHQVETGPASLAIEVAGPKPRRKNRNQD